jgi:UDP:flavonoid glycosyltransferase YjiC (YdhE family)
VYPYFAIAEKLVRDGHEVTLSLPQVFEVHAKQLGFTYALQNYDDINTLMENSTNNRELMAWMHRVTDKQFEEFVPILEKHDIMIATNTEFSAPHIAEYCGKPILRTAYAPFIAGRKIPPPVMPWPKPNPIIRPMVLWGALNIGVNLMIDGIINKNRKRLGMPPFKNQGEYAPSRSDNFLLYSPSLGSVDPDWKYPWHIGGYCFNDTIAYDQEKYGKLKAFIDKDDRPALFFTMGSCKAKKKDSICAWLFDICRRYDYNFVVGSGWWHTGDDLLGQNNMFLLDSFVPHNLVFPLCDGIIHHGGSGTSHSAARAGKPQMALPIFIDQHYFGNQIYNLKIGPHYLDATKVTLREIEKGTVDLMSNPVYKKNAAILGERVRSENGVQAICDYIYRKVDGVTEFKAAAGFSS